ncbi:hypothetical protein JR316_0004557 [Psilocybe cubensis]|uniref:Uncharacterized protein n=2 Tax=Psilocybe cubensis TaxID=181762 RepID=A0ACB8H486_PSICU|nr:hypothetical protein JR316_0004557 [Psilocybe cubensis]KAH9482457.1 hypothetical protein JR316_0004557 [Psilocybe cubensis]
MPFVDIHSADDYASIYYFTNTTYSNVGAFDPEKPTVVVLHPVFLDSTWLDTQLGDPRLHKNFNLIAFDMRSSGKSICRPNPAHDSWVDAADLAICFQRLHLPPSHILALEGTSVCCALRFAVLFPELCLSLALVNIPAPTELKWVYNNIDHLVHAASFAEDLESFEHAATELIHFIFGQETDPDLVEELVQYWEINYPPSRRLRATETANVYINRAPLSSDALASITQPVVIIHGDKNEICPVKYAERLQKELKGLEKQAVLYMVKGGSSMISIINGCASIVNNVFLKFLDQLPPARSDLEPPLMPVEDRMRAALQTLSEVTGRDITNLDPMSCISFSCLSQEALKIQTLALKHYQEDLSEAFTPDPVEGRALRSSGKEPDEWSYVEHGRSSINSTVIQPSERIKLQDLERGQQQRPPVRVETQHLPPDAAPLLKGFLVAGPVPNGSTTNLKKHKPRVNDNPQSATVPLQRMLASPF